MTTLEEVARFLRPKLPLGCKIVKCCKIVNRILIKQSIMSGRHTLTVYYEVNHKKTVHWNVKKILNKVRSW